MKKKTVKKQSAQVTTGLPFSFKINLGLIEQLKRALEASAIAPGKCVVLKSGSPVMTVERVYTALSDGVPQQNPGDKFVCVWFDELDAKDKRHAVFHRCVLQPLPRAPQLLL